MMRSGRRCVSFGVCRIRRGARRKNVNIEVSLPKFFCIALFFGFFTGFNLFFCVFLLESVFIL
jgi:hypothetical protein